MATQTKTVVHGCKSKHKSKRSMKNKRTGKYSRQAVRTAANKERKLAKYRREHPNWKP